MSRDKILIADDESFVRIPLSLVLQKTFPDFEIESFKCGEDLVKRLDSDLTGVRIVLLDNSMPPGMSGSEIINRYSKTVGFPFILNYGGDKLIGESAVKNGAYGYLRKPCEFDELRGLVRRALEREANQVSTAS